MGQDDERRIAGTAPFPARLLRGADQAARSQVGGVRGGRRWCRDRARVEHGEPPGGLVTRSHFDTTFVEPAVLCRVPRRRRRLRTTTRDGRVDGRSRSTGVLGRRREWSSVRTPLISDNGPVARRFYEPPRLAVTIPCAILIRILRDHLGPLRTARRPGSGTKQR